MIQLFYNKLLGNIARTKVHVALLGLYCSGIRKGERAAMLSDSRLEWPSGEK